MTQQRHTRAEQPVRVEEPGLSAEANRALTDEVVDALGRDTAQRGSRADERRPGRERSRGRPLPIPVLPSHFIFVLIGASLIVVGAIIALTTRDWWLLPAAVALLGLLTYAVLATVFSMTANRERPSPTTVAALEEEGVANPERLLSDLVADFTAGPGETGNRRDTPVEENPAQAAAEQEGSITPSGGPTRPAGPGEDGD